MSEQSKPADDAHGHGDGHDIHLPPNSWIPIFVAFAFSAIMIGFTVGPWLWILGLVLTAGGLVAWFRAARAEFEELPD